MVKKNYKTTLRNYKPKKDSKAFSGYSIDRHSVPECDLISHTAHEMLASQLQGHTLVFTKLRQEDPELRLAWAR